MPCHRPSTTSVQVKRNRMRDLEHMELLESTRMLASGPERLDLLEQIAALRIKLAAIAAKRKLLQSAKLHLRPSFAQTTPAWG
jgi:hypothetical protein